jgi:aspartate aminotransferase
MSEQFAERVRPLKAEGAYAVLARARALEAGGRDIIHLEIGQPDFPTPAPIAEAGAQAILAGHTRYVPPAGSNDLRAAIAETAGALRGMTFRPEEVVVGPGGKPGIFYAVMALVDRGDEVIIPDPGFPSYAHIVRIAGGVPVPVRLDPDALYNFDMGDFVNKLTPRTRLIIHNSPSNPTGGVTPLSALEQMASEIVRRDLWIISDEIYYQLVYDGEAPSVATLPGMREHTIIVDGFSKTYSMTGWRLGYAIMPAALADRVALLATHASGCTADFTQVAGVAALRGDQATVTAMRESFQARRDLTVAALNTIPGVTCAMPRGAFYAFPDIRSFGRTSTEMADYLLEEAGVALLAGSDFGAAGEGFLRISYATAPELIEQAMERMRAALARWQ